MECGGFIILLYNMFSIPPTIGIEKLPAVNWLMGSLFVRNPSIQPAAQRFLTKYRPFTTSIVRSLHPYSSIQACLLSILSFG